MDKIVVVFTMKSCPHCIDFKKILDESKLDYIERDIYEYEEEYEMFLEATSNEYVPAFMLIQNPESEKPITGLYAPDRDFENLDQGVNIIKKFYKR